MEVFKDRGHQYIPVDYSPYEYGHPHEEAPNFQKLPFHRLELTAVSGIAAKESQLLQ